MTLEYKQIKINYWTGGQGKALVFLHGFLENSKMWDKIIPHFKKDYNCIAIDLLGHGGTGCIGYIHKMEDMAAAVKAVLEHEGIKKAVFIGHSMGGYVALACLDIFPELVRGMVLLNATSYQDSEERKINRTRAIEVVKKNPDAYTSLAIANLFAEENRFVFSSEIDRIKEEALKMSLQGIISALEGMKVRKDRRKVLANFCGSKIVFAGIKDPILSYHQNVEECECAEVKLISFNGGHMTHIENTEVLVKSLYQFLLST